jgi:prepilin-type N-terminal cleavage/methylation domain-containing protein
MRRTDREHRGFTLIEVMVTLALVALAILPLLELRQRASNMAFRSGHMLQAMTYAQQLLADRATDPELVKDRQGVIEEDPVYRYEITVENFDLSTGRVENQSDVDNAANGGTNFTNQSAFAPSDAGAPPADTSDENDAYKVRRVKVTVYYPALEGDTEEKVELEGFTPRAIDPDADTLLKGTTK